MPDLMNKLMPNAQQMVPPVMTPGGGTTGAPLQPTPTQTPGGPLGGALGPVGGLFDSSGLSGIAAARQDWRDQRNDWHDQRPDHTQGMDPDAWRQAMMDWQGLRPQHPDFRAIALGQAPQNPLTPQAPIDPQAPLVPQLPPQVNQALPPIPVGGVGSSYGVIGAAPATGQFGLPVY